ncbi:MAG: oligosaccharide flippase family protein [Phycisphaeraceae bacterium]
MTTHGKRCGPPAVALVMWCSGGGASRTMNTAGFSTPNNTVASTATVGADQGHFSLKQRALSGSAWTLSAYVVQQLLRLAGNLVLTRLLVPQHFGLMAIVQVFLQGLQMFSDLGIGPAVVRDQRGEEPAFLRTAFTLQVIRGAALWIIVALLAWPTAMLYGEPMLAQILPVAGLNALILGFESTRTRLVKRHLVLGRLNVLNVVAQAVGLVCTVSLALAYRSVWALVAGSLIVSATRIILGHMVLPGARDGFGWDRSCFIAIYQFGRVILGSSAVFFVSSQLDRILLGKYVGMEVLGVYSIAWMIAHMVVQANKSLARQVAFPALSRIHRDQPERMREVYYRTRRSLDWLFLPGIGVGIGCGMLVIAVLYDPRYLAAGGMLQILLIWPAMRCVLEPGEACLVAMGHPRFAFIQNIVRFCWVIVAVPGGWYLLGLEGVLLAVASSELPVVPVIWYGKQKYGILDLKREAQAALKLMAGVVVGMFIMSLW